MVDLMGIVGDPVQWNVSFTRVAQDWEIDSFEDLFRLLYSMKPIPQGSDTLWWVPVGKRYILSLLFL